MKTLLPLILLASASLQAAEPVELKLWNPIPGRMQPPSKATQEFIRTKAGKGTITGVHEPTITLYRPEQPNGTSVVVAPGGSFAFLSAVHEGTQVCEWLNRLGITAILLKYRTPTLDDAAPHDKPVQDALRAIALVRENARAWKLDPQRVGLLGFGAGGNVAARLACDRAWQGQRPNFCILIYGDRLVDPTEPKLDESFSVPADAPPLFMACTHGNEQAFLALTALHMAQAQHRTPAAVHLSTKGGHNFRPDKTDQAADGWPQRCAQWMDARGWLPSEAAVTKMDDQIAKTRAKLQEMQLAIKRWSVGNDDPRMDSRQIRTQRTEVRLALLKAERAGDKVKIDELNDRIASADRLLKVAEEGEERWRLALEEEERTREMIIKLEVERARIVRMLADSHWP